MNDIFLKGRLTADPERRKTEKGLVVYFQLAVDRPVKSGGEKKTDFPLITVFDKTAENVLKYTGSGLRVIVKGRVQTSRYEKDGVLNYSMNIIGNQVEFIDWKETKAAPEPKPAAAPEPKPAAETAPVQAVPTSAQTVSQEQADSFNSCIDDEDF